MTRLIVIICVWIGIYFYRRSKNKKQQAEQAQAELDEKFAPPPDSAEALNDEVKRAWAALPVGTPEEQQAFVQNSFALYLATGAVLSLRERLNDFLTVQLFVLPDQLVWRVQTADGWTLDRVGYDSFRESYGEMRKISPEIGADEPFSALKNQVERSALNTLLLRELEKEPRLQAQPPSYDGFSYQAAVSADGEQKEPTDPRAQLEWQMQQILNSRK